MWPCQAGSIFPPPLSISTSSSSSFLLFCTPPRPPAVVSPPLVSSALPSGSSAPFSSRDISVQANTVFRLQLLLLFLHRLSFLLFHLLLLFLQLLLVFLLLLPFETFKFWMAQSVPVGSTCRVSPFSYSAFMLLLGVPNIGTELFN